MVRTSTSVPRCNVTCKVTRASCRPTPPIPLPRISMLFKHRRRRPTGGPAYQRGQGLVEFALIVPALFLILGAIIQFGIWFWDQNTLNQLVRDARRSAAPATNCTAAVCHM